MSAIGATRTPGAVEHQDRDHDHNGRTPQVRRLSTETKASYKTTEFFAYLVVLAGILIAGAITKASSYSDNHDPFRADRVWLYATILTVGYMISRGIAKAGSNQPYDERS